MLSDLANARRQIKDATRFGGCMGGSTIFRGLSLLDGGALIAGAAIAAIHLRLAFPAPQGVPAWCFVAGLFLWLAVTAAGPFLYLARRLAPRRGAAFPLVGDRLWVLWGLPWVAAGVIASVQSSRMTLPAGRLDPIYVGGLGMGLFLASAVAVPVLAVRLLWGEPGPIRRGERSWTQWVGLALSATWPIQVGVGLLLIG